MSRRSAVPFVLLAAIWGSSFLLIKVGVEELAPLQVALGRVLLGLVALLPLLLLRGERLPPLRAWVDLAVVALFLNTLPFTLFAWGETHVPSVLAGIWNAATPLLTLVVVLAALPDERPTRERAAGLVVGFVGVVVVLGPWQGLGGSALLGNLACLGAAACYGVGTAYSRRRLSGLAASAVSLSAAQLACAAVELAVVTVPFTRAPHALPAKVVAAVAVLGAVGTGLAYILYHGLIRSAGATTASTVTYLIPLFSTVLGVAALGEGLSWNEPVGALVVLGGVAVSQGLARAATARLAARFGASCSTSSS